MSDTRYFSKEIPISPQEAQQRRDSDVQYIKDQIANLQSELAQLLASPLQTTTTQFLELHPGDPDYDQAPYETSIHYGGSWSWKPST